LKKDKLNIDLKNKDDFEEVFRIHYSNLCAYANQFLNDVDASEEVVQDIFYKLWNNREKIEISSSVKSYLFRSVRNSCLNTIKHINIREEYKEHNEREMKTEESNYDDIMQTSEIEEKIRETIDLLPTERRKVFIMSRFDGLKYKEIAEKQNISIKTVENQMGKAIKFMREKLSTYVSLFFIIIFEFINKVF